MILRIVSSSAVLIGLLAGAVRGEPDGAAIYADLCASCHAETRLGGKGPALIPESLGRLKGDKLAAVISEGRAMTQMPAFKDTLSPEDITAVAAFIAAPLATLTGLGRGRDHRLPDAARRLHTCRRPRLHCRPDERDPCGGNRRQPCLGP